MPDVRILLVPDSFKECLSATEVCTAMETGIRRVLPDAKIVSMPMADGGEGTLDAMLSAVDGERYTVPVHGPLAEVVEADYGIVHKGKTAIIESAQAAGLHLILQEMRRPYETTTLGVGQLIRHAMSKGVERVWIGLGGSGTNDAGAGMAQALGYSLRDKDDVELTLGGLALERLDWIDSHKVAEGLRYVEVVAACDVDNPLCGPNGATQVYGPQKGATPEMIERLDAALRHFGEFVEEELDKKIIDVPGSGAAGGLAAGLITFANAELRPGFDLMNEAYGIADAIEECDWVLTGEGKLDGQSLHGKAPIGIARLAREAGKPCAAIVGTLGSDTEKAEAEGLSPILALSKPGEPPEVSIREAEKRIADATEKWAREHASS